MCAEQDTHAYLTVASTISLDTVIIFSCHKYHVKSTSKQHKSDRLKSGAKGAAATNLCGACARPTVQFSFVRSQQGVGVGCLLGLVE